VVFCYAPNDVVTSASSQGSCIYPEHCPYLKTEMTNQQPEVMSSGTAIISDENGVPTKVHLSDKEKLTEMTKPTDADNDALFGKDLRVYSKKELETKKMDSVESIEAEIKMLQSKLEFYKELENHKTPCEIAFKRVYDVYPQTDVGDGYWENFQAGYNAAYEEIVSQGPAKKKSLYQFLAEWKYGIEKGDIIPQFDNDEFSVFDWSQIFIEYLYECGDIISEDKDEIVIKLKQTQLEIAND